MAPLPDVRGGVPAANHGRRGRYDAFARVRLSRLDEVRWERFSRKDRTGRSLGRPMTAEVLRRPPSSIRSGHRARPFEPNAEGHPAGLESVNGHLKVRSFGQMKVRTPSSLLLALTSS